MVLFLVVAIPVILIFAGLGLLIKNPRHWVLGKIIFEFKQYERGVVFRFGKYHRLVGPGWVFIIPIIETFAKYDLRVETIDVAPQEVITKDAVKLTIDAVIYLKVEDAVKAELVVEEDYRKAVEEHVKSRIRNVVGNLELQDLYARITEINKQLKDETQKLTAEWGVDIITIELQRVTPPEDVVEAMKAEEVALLYKNAAVQEAESTKIRIRALEEAAGGLSNSTIAYLYLKALKDVADGKATKIIFPMELTRVAEKLASGLGGNMPKERLEQLLESVVGKK
ncbi:TPA: SPFH domain-containing protein [archaeon]|uniref:SPFH domain-containing protein n=1 Tax=Candidatus Naiadarchaeum limnaeum TaxID=2756139 RepID=A0A832URS7_9ARCH|nr:SPFH domain-containing protein [Candidatus Naiadarchaeum limnaeum]